MDEQSKQVKGDDGINRSDLPEISLAIHSNSEQQSRRSKLLRNSCFFLIVYSCVHKLIIPVILKILGTSRPEYSEIDFWFVPMIVLFFSLFFSKEGSYLTRAIMGALIAHALREVYFVSQGIHSGWMTFSHLLSSIPIAGLSIFYLERFYSSRKLVVPWVVALLVLVLPIFLDNIAKDIFNEKLRMSMEESVLASGEPSQKNTASAKPVEKNCGNAELFMTDADHVSKGSDFFEVQITECGLAPAYILLSENTIRFRNLLLKPVNLHLLIKTASGERRNQNFLLPPDGTKQIEIMIGADGEAAMVYSDAFPELGLVAVLVNQFKGSWSFSRLPLKMERLR